ncbi:HugZ family heme oxygenase [Helicobacter sp. CLO-3]|uniref:HugZ family heme oxygenase n=1 Tax=unclassified Helicobacter TaxID=2593540 RepID=UPI000805BF2F|nr:MULTISPECIES: HugZ family heme oxygenase [unclassified Helicobacter]OBV29448.1 HugZ family heme oxygenase [Helicobacter sp. CLO-3]OHU84655.1 HugZ family heme oxygenase [Helicobacter sp. CLO-3]
MSFESVISHMNGHHQKELEGLVAKFGGVKGAQGVKLESVDFEGLDIAYDGGKVRVEFPQKATPETIKNIIIELCMSVEKTHDLDSVEQEVVEFAKSFGSAVLASLNPKGEVLATYSAVIHHKSKFYIYVSEVAEHYESIKANPKNIELMFLEDESKAKSVILRKRLRYRVEARFVERESSEFNEVFDAFIAQTGGAGGIKTIRNMTDFHLIELIAHDGRFVKGFGQAYALHNGKATYLGGGGNPHSKNPHK